MYDQAIYAKAFKIKCKEPDKFSDVFLMMGAFHIILTSFAVIAARFNDAGLRDIVVQSFSSLSIVQSTLLFKLWQRAQLTLCYPILAVIRVAF